MAMRFEPSGAVKVAEPAKECRKLTIDGYTVEYAVVSSKYGGDPSFSPLAAYVAGMDEEGKFYVSEAFPEQYRDPILVHEYYHELVRRDLGERQAHHKAIAQEIKAAAEKGVLSEHINFRIGLYIEAIRFLREKFPDDPEIAADEEQDMAIFKSARRHYS